MGLTLRLVALFGLILCIVTTLSSPVYPDTGPTKVASGRQSGETDTCAMFASLSACSTNDILCSTGSNEAPWNCDKQCQVWLDQPADNSCHSMTISSDQDVFGGPMHCVKNEDDPLAPSNCSDNWTGTWVVFDNGHCDWSGKNFQWPVAAGWNLTWSPLFGAKSVQYINNGGFFQFVPPPPKRRDADFIKRETADSNPDPNADRHEARAIDPPRLDCSMLSSLSPCTSGDILCSWSDKSRSWDCSKQHESQFTYPTEKKCVSLMDPDKRGNNPGGPMQCVKNQGNYANTVGCPANLTGDWVVFDNANCDWSGQNYQWPVSSGARRTYTPPFAAKSVTYLNNNGFFQFGPPSRENRDMVSTASDSEVAAHDLGTHANLNDARFDFDDTCVMYSSLSDCSTGAVTGSVSYQTVWDGWGDVSCRNLSKVDPHGQPGGAMSCVQNVRGCPKDWTGYWVVYDNDNCDDSRQAFTVPVIAAADTGFQLPFGGLSVKYEMFLPPHLGTLPTARNPLENRQVNPCTLITSLLECSNENVWCRGEDCSMGYEWDFAASDRACRSLTGTDKTGKVGDAMYCVKNQEAANGFGRCDAGWDGFWIFYNNANCDQRGQTFSVPVYLDDNGRNFESVSGAMSVKYSYFPKYPGYGGFELPASASATARL